MLLEKITKNDIDTDKKPKIYFTCHPDDFEMCFDKICEDIFRTHDCVIFYKKDMSAAVPEEDKELDLARNNLFARSPSPRGHSNGKSRPNRNPVCRAFG